MAHLKSNMISLLEFGPFLEQKKGSRFVLLSMLLGGQLANVVLRTAYLYFNGFGPWHGLKTQSTRKHNLHCHLRFGTGFSGICLHLETLFALESTLAWPLRLLALLELCGNAISIDGDGNKKPHLKLHWGHMMGMVTGLLQAGYMTIRA
jgi:hypothetical protein